MTLAGSGAPAHIGSVVDDVGQHSAPSPREPMTLEQLGDEIVLGCTWCGVEARSPVEPAQVFAEIMETFVRDHAWCRDPAA